MSGHSKWSTIKRKKGAADAKRSKLFSRISKEITIATQMGGDEIEANPRLRLAVQNAKGANMSKDVIQRAINKANKDNSRLEETTFEGYGPHGIAVFVECLTDNNNRTVGSVRAAFTKFHGSLGTNGSLSFLFDRNGIFTFPKGEIDLEELELELIDGGAEDIEEEENYINVTTALEDFGMMSKKLEELSIEPESQELQRIPNNTTALGVEGAKSVLKLIDRLEEDEDVQKVFHNLEMTEELQQALENE